MKKQTMKSHMLTEQQSIGVLTQTGPGEDQDSVVTAQDLGANFLQLEGTMREMTDLEGQLIEAAGG